MKRALALFSIFALVLSFSFFPRGKTYPCYAGTFSTTIATFDTPPEEWEAAVFSPAPGCGAIVHNGHFDAMLAASSGGVVNAAAAYDDSMSIDVSGSTEIGVTVLTDDATTAMANPLLELVLNNQSIGIVHVPDLAVGVPMTIWTAFQPPGEIAEMKVIVYSSAVPIRVRVEEVAVR